MGNRVRVQEGEKPLRLADILRRRDIWKFILIRDQKIKESKFNKKYASNDYISGCGVTPNPIVTTPLLINITILKQEEWITRS